MTKTQGNFIIIAILFAIFSAFYLYTESENRAAISSGDPGRCWGFFHGTECKSAALARMLGI